MRKTSTESVNERGSAALERPKMLGTLAAGGGAAWPAASSAIAHRRGPLPAAPMPRTPPQHAPRRNAPWVTRSASWPGQSSRTRRADRRAKGHGAGAAAVGARPEARPEARAANLGRRIPAPVRMDGAKPRLYRAGPRPRPGVLTPGLFSTEPRGTG